MKNATIVQARNGNSKRYVLFIIVALVVLIALLAGCTQPAPATRQPPTPSPTPIPAPTLAPTEPPVFQPPQSPPPVSSPSPAYPPPLIPSQPPPPKEPSPPAQQEPPPVFVPLVPPDVAPLKITVRSEIPGGNERAIDSFLQTYPFLVKYLGEPFSIGIEGVNWEYDADAPGWGWDAETNTVQLNANILQQNQDQAPYAKLDESFQHETAHLFYDVGDTAISFNFGQWIWEAHALAGQALANQDMLGVPTYGVVATAYDTQANIGYEALNGVLRDGEKWNRTIVDSSATQALLMLADVLSSDSDRDFLKKVNAGILARYRATKNVEISPETYRAILNEAAAGKKIDGQSPGDWLFAQPVANVAGKTGDYLAVVPQYSAAWYGMELFPTRFWAFAFRREKSGQDYRETVLEGLEVTLTVYDADGEAEGQTIVQSAGGIGTELDSWELFPPDIRDGAYLVRAEANAGGETLVSYNYFVMMRQASKVTIEDNRLIVVLTNASGTALVPEIPAGMTVTGGEVQETLPGVLVVTAAPGAAVTFHLGSFEKIISKPLTARVVSLRLP